MEDKKPKVLLQTQDWEYYCGDGCCYDYGTYIYVNGKQATSIEGLYEGIEPIIEVLETLGYEVEKEKLEFQTHDLRIDFEEEM